LIAQGNKARYSGPDKKKRQLAVSGEKVVGRGKGGHGLAVRRLLPLHSMRGQRVFSFSRLHEQEIRESG
jgi:hypothetical protein